LPENIKGVMYFPCNKVKKLQYEDIYVLIRLKIQQKDQKLSKSMIGIVMAYFILTTEMIDSLTIWNFAPVSLQN
jgi:hypothetical protein